MTSIQYFIFSLPVLIFSAGIVGVLVWQKNIILIIISLEISFVASSLGLILSSIYLDDILGQVLSLFAITIAGAEVSLGLALAIVLYRKIDNIFIKNLKHLKS